jgi:hypothetical protein
MARSSPAKPARGPARRAASADSVDTMKLTGALFCISAVASMVVPFVRKEAFGEGAEGAASAGSAALVLLLGAGLYQGAGVVRGLVLVCAGLAALASLAAIPLFGSFRPMQLLMAATCVTSVGYLVLLLKTQASRARAALGVLLVVGGATALLSTPLGITGLTRSAFGNSLRPLLSDQREYADAASGLSLSVPPGWSIMRPDAELFASVPAKVKLADPDAGTVVFINDEPRGLGFVSLDHQLDLVLERQKASGLDPKQRDRVDATVGRAVARRMSLGWTHEGQPFSGFVSVWLDGPQVFTLFGAAVGGGAASTDERFRALEQALHFSAPVETALADAEKSLLRECPVFSADAVRMIGRKIPPASPAEAYFKTGWAWAVKGQRQMDPARAAELRDLMGAVYQHMGASERTRFGAYTERVRGGASTTPDEDAQSMRILGKAAAALPADSVAKLRATIDTAITVGGLL